MPVISTRERTHLMKLAWSCVSLRCAGVIRAHFTGDVERGHGRRLGGGWLGEIVKSQPLKISV